MATVKLNLGSGDTKLDGFISVDLYDKTADVCTDIGELPYKDNSVDEIVCYQAIEHVPYNKSESMFREWYRVLKVGATAIVETPDIEVVCRKILEEGLTDTMMFNLVGEYYRPHDKDRYDDWEMCASAIHRNPWTLERFTRITEPIGFTVTKRPKADYYSEYEETASWLLRKL